MASGYSSGIYCIENVVNDRRYVGSAVNIDKRWKEHRRQLGAGRHHSRFLQREWDKRGESAFRFALILFCDRENLLMYEQALLDSWKPEYNSAPTAGSQLGYRHTEETRRKLSAVNKRIGNSGYRHTDESKARISASKSGVRIGPPSQETRRKIGDAHRGRPRSQEYRAKISSTLTGTKTGRGLLSAEQVVEVRSLRALGFGRIRIGRAMGISEWAADAVIGNHAYGWVK